MDTYRDLKVYKNSYRMAIQVYKELGIRLPTEERYGLISQLKRAATSIPLNIAEGYGKWVSGKELQRFLLMARGSCCEMEVLLNIIMDLGYVSYEEYSLYSKEYDEIGKMLTGLIKSIKSTQLTTNN